MKEMPQIVTRRLLAGQGRVLSQSHPDANLLGAFGEGLLDSGERLQIMEHLAACLDCREVAMLSVPSESAAMSTVRSSPSTTWQWPVLRWGAAMACIAIIGTAITFSFKEHRSAQMEIAANSAPSTKVVPPEAANTEPSPAASSQTAEPSTNPLPKSNLKADGSSHPRAKKSGALDSSANSLLADSDVAPQSSSPANGPNMRQSFAPPANAISPALAARIVIPTAPLWTLTADGRLQRSLDGGKEWTNVTVSPNVHFLAVSASQREVWVVGMGGAVYHSTDGGQNWRHVKPVAGEEQLSADVTGVQFLDAAHVQMTTGSATWLTDDGGETWRKK